MEVIFTSHLTRMEHPNMQRWNDDVFLRTNFVSDGFILSLENLIKSNIPPPTICANCDRLNTFQKLAHKELIARQETVDGIRRKNLKLWREIEAQHNLVRKEEMKASSLKQKIEDLKSKRSTLKQKLKKLEKTYQAQNPTTREVNINGKQNNSEPFSTTEISHSRVEEYLSAAAPYSNEENKDISSSNHICIHGLKRREGMIFCMCGLSFLEHTTFSNHLEFIRDFPNNVIVSVNPKLQ